MNSTAANSLGNRHFEVHFRVPQWIGVEETAIVEAANEGFDS